MIMGQAPTLLQLTLLPALASGQNHNDSMIVPMDRLMPALSILQLPSPGIDSWTQQQSWQHTLQHSLTHQIQDLLLPRRCWVLDLSLCNTPNSRSTSSMWHTDCSA
eukprot:jgi/Ulvmu1/3645/UM017_0059.1